MTAGGRGLWDGWLCMQRITDISVMLAASTPIARCFSHVCTASTFSLIFLENIFKMFPESAVQGRESLDV